MHKSLLCCLPIICLFLLINSHVSFVFNSPASSGEIASNVKTMVDRQQILRLVNDARSRGRQCGSSYENAAQPLKWNVQLQRAAQQHSEDMYRRNYFSHTSKDGTPFYMRIRRQGYDYFTCAENIGKGYESELSVIKGWLGSPGHCSNLMGSAHTDFAVARTGEYWVMVLGSKD